MRAWLGKAPVGTLERTATPVWDGLSYQVYADRYYYYPWKTQNDWGGTCRAFVLTLADGTATRCTSTS